MQNAHLSKEERQNVIAPGGGKLYREKASCHLGGYGEEGFIKLDLPDNTSNHDCIFPIEDDDDDNDSDTDDDDIYNDDGGLDGDNRRMLNIIEEAYQLRVDIVSGQKPSFLN